MKLIDRIKEDVKNKKVNWLQYNLSNPKGKSRYSIFVAIDRVNRRGNAVYKYFNREIVATHSLFGDSVNSDPVLQCEVGQHEVNINTCRVSGVFIYNTISLYNDSNNEEL